MKKKCNACMTGSGKTHLRTCTNLMKVGVAKVSGTLRPGLRCIELYACCCMKSHSRGHS